MSSASDPQSWLSAKVSSGYVADYKPFSFVDGEGVRCSVYLSGCLFKCEGCFNEEAWSFKFGQPYTAELEERIISDLSHPSVQGLSLLGGEPFLNTGVATALVARVRREFGQMKDVWCWSGYRLEELMVGSEDKRELLSHLDVLVDGKFEIAQRDLTLRFRGSANQRVIDVKASLSVGAAVPIPHL